MSFLPNQQLPTDEKDKAWGQDCVNHLISQTNFGWSGITPSWRDQIHSYYDYYNGVVDDNDYTHVLKPYGKTRKNMPAKLHNYPIIRPVVDLLLGEKVKRPRSYSVVVTSPDVIDKKKEALFATLKENFTQHFKAEVERVQAQEGLQPTQMGGPGPQEALPQPPDPRVAASQFESSYKDHRALQGEEALQYIRYDKNLVSEHLKGWKDWLIAGVVFSHKDVVGGDLHYEILNPLDVDYDKSPDTDWIEDGEWAAIHKVLTPSDVVKTFWDKLTPKQINQIYDPAERVLEVSRTDDNRNGETLRENGVQIVKVFWKSLKKYKTVLYEDEWGITRERDEDEEYEAVPGEEAIDVWIPEVWQGTRINKNIFVDIKPHPIQRNKINDKGHCKLPINGRKYSDRNSPNISIVALGVPYQLTYNIYKYRLENEIAKAKGMIAQIDLALIPKDWKLDRFLYYMEASGIAFFQSEVEGEVRPSNTHKQVLDLSVKAIEQYIALLSFTKEEYETQVGVTRQRQGMMSPYDGKGTTEQSIINASHITEDLFSRYEEFEAREYSGLLDLSKIAYVSGKKASYVTPEGRQAFVEIDGEEHMESEYGVFVSGGAKEQNKLETLRAYGSQMASGGNVPISILASIIEAESFSSLKAEIKKTEDELAKISQQQQEAEQAMVQQQAQAEQMKLEHTSNENALDRDNKIQVALITSQEKDDDGAGKLALDAEKQRADDTRDRQRIRIEQEGQRLDERKQRADERSRERELDLKAKEVAVKKIAARKPSSSK